MSINETLSNIGLGFVIFGCLLILFNNIFLWIKKRCGSYQLLARNISSNSGHCYFDYAEIRRMTLSIFLELS